MAKMITTIVTDIEGTTTPIRFVTETLFPFARAHLADFINQAGEAPEIAALLADARRLADEPDLDNTGTVALLHRWMDEDRKATPLKSLQGLIWERGYRDGLLKGVLYPDAVTALKVWHHTGLRLYVYSSGSVMAQKLLFGYSTAGDLTPLFSGYFDTTTGPKLVGASYRKIADAVETPPEAILFLSDHPGELDAAASVGLKTAWLVREDMPPPDHDCAHPIHHAFTTIIPV